MNLFGREIRVWPKERNTKRRTVVVALAVAFVLVLAFLWWVPVWEVQQYGVAPTDNRFPELVDQFRSTWATLAGGIAIAIGLWFTWQQVELRRQGQITDRLSKAVDQLGDEDLAIRLGAIYALERIAQDSERDHWPVMEVLSAYVREKSPLERAEGKGEDVEDSTDTKPPTQSRQHRLPDVQAALTVIGRRRIDWEDLTLNSEEHMDKYLDLRDADLSYAQIPGADLQRAFLSFSSLQGADLRSADLSGAELLDTEFRGAYLYRANLSGAHLHDADLSSSGGTKDIVLRDADCRRANLRGCDLAGADLRNANLVAADLSYAKLDEADLRGAYLWGAEVWNSQISKAVIDEDTVLPDHLSNPEKSQN